LAESVSIAEPEMTLVLTPEASQRWATLCSRLSALNMRVATRGVPLSTLTIMGWMHELQAMQSALLFPRPSSYRLGRSSSQIRGLHIDKKPTLPSRTISSMRSTSRLPPTKIIGIPRSTLWAKGRQ